MKRITTLFLLILSAPIFSQTNTEEKEKSTAGVSNSIFGVQAGFLGAWAYNELKLTDKIVLKSELGLQTYTLKTKNPDKTFTFLTPEIVLEPRFYYNIQKRADKGKDVSHNSGNFISLRSSYFPDSFTVGEKIADNAFIPELHIVPTWGMKRNLSDHFNYELGAGLGYRKVFETNLKQNNNNDDVAFYLHARIGYKF
ncbi:hypothetical protein [Flavobacterium suncheonense]|uniref:Outer membrane protein beta-barrel domain-containing protein n=1 Tax=Flavobacterium suncheonense GH29-5 = DSM 17707 TaxID=1121899 RepID=A0A0A2MD93_9FLAO|nr:hypothetical protein [Flavobacterium suncheonense]KGO89581.1 hypothetical protein Q764_07370 [Flavobacterium suncheonense GH29-5 = DSM 17707]